MTNPIHPKHLSAAERLAELAGILATGLVRLRSPKSSGLSVDRGDSCLDFPEPRSRHEPVKTRPETPS